MHALTLRMGRTPRPVRLEPDPTPCPVCGGPRLPLAREAGDRYCSAACAKRAHGVHDRALRSRRRRA